MEVQRQRLCDVRTQSISGSVHEHGHSSGCQACVLCKYRQTGRSR